MSWWRGRRAAPGPVLVVTAGTSSAGDAATRRPASPDGQAARSGDDGLPAAGSDDDGLPAAERLRRQQHVLQELRFEVGRHGDGLIGSAEVTPPMWVPGTECLRLSILAIWVDMVVGLMAVEQLAPSVPVTVELDVHLHRPAPGQGTVTAVGRPLRSGRSVFVGAVDLAVDGEPFGVGGASFTTARDPTLAMPRRSPLERQPLGPPLAVPLAERVGSRRVAPGRVELPRRPDGLNAAGTLNGGLIALAAEEAAVSLVEGASAVSLGLRYLRPVRLGPLVATADGHDGLVSVALRDAGHANRLAATAVLRLLPPAALVASGPHPAAVLGTGP